MLGRKACQVEKGREISWNPNLNKNFRKIWASDRSQEKHVCQDFVVRPKTLGQLGRNENATFAEEGAKILTYLP